MNLKPGAMTPVNTEKGPAFRVFSYDVQVNPDESAEVINLLSQVMTSYDDHLDEWQKIAVAEWFKANYGK